MKNTAIPLRDLQAALNAMELALNDDRAHRVTLPKETYFALSGAHGVLQGRLEQMGIELPVAQEVAYG